MGLFKKLFSIFKRKKEKKQESVEDEKNNLPDSSKVLDSSTDVKVEKKEKVKPDPEPEPDVQVKFVGLTMKLLSIDQLTN